MLSFEPIGIVESCFPERFGTPRQPGLAPSTWCRVRLHAKLNLNDALDGLCEFSHLWVLFVFHKNANQGFNCKVHPPRLDGKAKGLFATRTPHRPNPIGITCGKIEKVSTNCIELSGIDIIDGSPVLDIKPYLKEIDAIAQANSGWVDGLTNTRLEIDFSPGAFEQLKSLGDQDRQERLKRMIQETLELDPRPGFYKGTAQSPNPYTDTYGFRLEDLNVVFRVQAQSAMVVEIKPWRV